MSTPLVRFHVHVPPDFPRRLRQLVAAGTAATGIRQNQGDVLMALVEIALERHAGDHRPIPVARRAAR